MGQFRNDSAATRHAVRAAIQRSQVSISRLPEMGGYKPQRQKVKPTKSGTSILISLR